jgi:cysteine desulfurase
LITSAIEHKAILATAQQLRDLHGFEVTIVPVDRFGQVDPADVARAIRPNTALISIMAANNEIGTLQPVAEIGRIAREHGILFHSDAVQAIAMQPWDMTAQPVDLLSIAPHKFYGPKGVGVLYVRDGIDLVAPLTGGSQENDRRPGTENVAFAVGAARALELAQRELPQLVPHYQSLRDALIGQVSAELPEACVLTGHPTQRLPNHASFALRDLSANDLLMHLDMGGVAAGSGSACSTGNPKPSAVLTAIGLDETWSRGGLRFTVGRSNSENDIDTAVAVLARSIRNLQRLRAYN